MRSFTHSTLHSKSFSFDSSHTNFSFHNLLQKLLIPHFVTKTSHSTIANKNFSVHHSQQKLLIKQFVARNVSFHSSQKNLLIPQFAANKSHSRICSKIFLFSQSIFATEPSQSTIGSIKFSFHNWQQRSLITQFTIKTSDSKIGRKVSHSTLQRKNLVIPQIAAKTCHSTICSKQLSFHNSQ